MWKRIASTRQAGRPSPSREHRLAWSPIRYAVAASRPDRDRHRPRLLDAWSRPAVAPAVVATSTTAATDSAVTQRDRIDVASVQHLTAVEAMLTSFRAGRRLGNDLALQRWARDLLASTRLLMDSPAGEDAVRRQLLEDLEYVLAQIVQLDPNAPAEDRALVDRAINREQVLTRVRSSIPAGFSRGT